MPEISQQMINIAQKAMEQQQQSPQGPGKASEQDVAKFQEAMEGQSGEQAQGVDGVQQTQQSAEVQGAAETGEPSLADKMIQSISQTGKQMEAARDEIINTVQSESLSPQDLIKAQFKVAEFTMQQTMVGKVGEKSSQGAQTLMRGQ